MITKPEQLTPGQVVSFSNDNELTVKSVGDYMVHWVDGGRSTLNDPVIWILAELKVNKHEDLNHYVLDEKGQYKDKETWSGDEFCDRESYTIEQVLEWLEQDVVILRTALGKDSR
jgi:hypothetical protein